MKQDVDGFLAVTNLIMYLKHNHCLKKKHLINILLLMHLYQHQLFLNVHLIKQDYLQKKLDEQQ